MSDAAIGDAASSECSGCLASATQCSAGAESGSIALEPGEIAFGDVAIGIQETVGITLSALGSQPLYVCSVTARGSNTFSAEQAESVPYAVSSGGTTLLRARYVPAEVETDTGTVTIESSDPADAIIVVPLSGNGVAGP